MKINTQLGKVWFGLKGNQVCVCVCVCIIFIEHKYLFNIKNKRLAFYLIFKGTYIYKYQKKKRISFIWI